MHNCQIAKVVMCALDRTYALCERKKKKKQRTNEQKKNYNKSVHCPNVSDFMCIQHEREEKTEAKRRTYTRESEERTCKSNGSHSSNGYNEYKNEMRNEREEKQQQQQQQRKKSIHMHQIVHT